MNNVVSSKSETDRLSAFVAARLLAVEVRREDPIVLSPKQLLNWIHLSVR